MFETWNAAAFGPPEKMFGGFTVHPSASRKMNDLAQLRLLHLADSALPVGAMSHSFGLEAMVAELGLAVPDLEAFFCGWLSGTGTVEAVYCMRAWMVEDAEAWRALNDELTARKLARESRDASLALGRRFMRLAGAVVDDARLALPGPAHCAAAFGLVSGILGVERATAAAAFLHQSLYGAISACQRLLPLGQSAATVLLWHLKPQILQAAGEAQDREPDQLWNPQPLLEMASMRHPRLATRLFIS